MPIPETSLRDMRLPKTSLRNMPIPETSLKSICTGNSISHEPTLAGSRHSRKMFVEEQLARHRIRITLWAYTGVCSTSHLNVLRLILSVLKFMSIMKRSRVSHFEVYCKIFLTRNIFDSKCYEKPLRIRAAEAYCTSITLRAAAESWSLLYESLLLYESHQMSWKSAENASGWGILHQYYSLSYG